MLHTVPPGFPAPRYFRQCGRRFVDAGKFSRTHGRFPPFPFGIRTGNKFPSRACEALSGDCGSKAQKSGASPCAREALSICPVLKFDREEVSPRTRRFLGMRRLLLALLSPRIRRSPPWNGMKKPPCFRLAVCASFVCGLFGFCKFNALNLIFVCFDAANPGKGSTIFRIIIRENSQRFLSLVRAIFKGYFHFSIRFERIMQRHYAFSLALQTRHAHRFRNHA